MQRLLRLSNPATTGIARVIEQNLMNPVSIEDLAYLSGRSLSELQTSFQRNLQYASRAQWIREKKLYKAKEMLTNPTLSVTNTWNLTGFSNFSHFSRVFKERLGYSPLYFKRKYVR